MTNLTEFKETLRQYYNDCIAERHHKMKRLADAYNLPRKRYEKAFALGEKLFKTEQMRAQTYLNERLK
jgi:isopenicillin N synthase-like dioxygenase